jgi:hypothetical protein
MNKPGDLMIGILDFFAVLLPGAIATWLLSPHLPDDLRRSLQVGSGEDASIVPWIVYLLTSYALGHFVFMGGSRLDPVYDRWRKRTKPLEAEVPYQAAKKLRHKLTPSLPGDGFSTFKWARSYIGVHSPQARVEIDRIEATSKFFRGMVVISVALAAHFLIVRLNAALAAGAVLVCVLSFWRYCDQRWKMTELTYATAVIVHETKAKTKGAKGENEEKDEND